MSNLFDYMAWRGDLTLAQDPLNPIDHMILTRISYLPLQGIVDGPGGRSVTLRAASRYFFTLPNWQELLLMKHDGDLFRQAAQCPRYQNVLLSRFAEDTDLEAQKQFGAVTLTLEDGTRYISFRGTDDTLVGWKEDFNMGCLDTVPSQEEALRYFVATAAALPGPFWLAGHSKGGNLATYCAIHCGPELQARIVGVVNNDGPGFRENQLHTPEYQAVADRIQTYVPQSSVVGMLLFHSEDFHVVRSSQIGILQHDLYSWQVEGREPIYLKGVPPSLKFSDQTLRLWVGSLPPEGRAAFVEGLYNILASTNYTTLSEMRKNSAALYRAVIQADAPERNIVIEGLTLLLRAACHSLPEYWAEQIKAHPLRNTIQERNLSHEKIALGSLRSHLRPVRSSFGTKRTAERPHPESGEPGQQ